MTGVQTCALPICVRVFFSLRQTEKEREREREREREAEKEHVSCGLQDCGVNSESDGQAVFWMLIERDRELRLPAELTTGQRERESEREQLLMRNQFTLSTITLSLLLSLSLSDLFLSVVFFI